MFVVTLLMLALQVSCDTVLPYRRLPFNGSMYGKRAASILPSGMCVIQRLRFMHFLTLSDQVNVYWGDDIRPQIPLGK